MGVGQRRRAGRFEVYGAALLAALLVWSAVFALLPVEAYVSGVLALKLWFGLVTLSAGLVGSFFWSRTERQRKPQAIEE